MTIVKTTFALILFNYQSFQFKYEIRRVYLQPRLSKSNSFRLDSMIASDYSVTLYDYQPRPCWLLESTELKVQPSASRFTVFTWLSASNACDLPILSSRLFGLPNLTAESVWIVQKHGRKCLGEAKAQEKQQQKNTDSLTLKWNLISNFHDHRVMTS